ncbi:hypothetical protein ES703_10565 [subsurface metagenome]
MSLDVGPPVIMPSFLLVTTELKNTYGLIARLPELKKGLGTGLESMNIIDNPGTREMFLDIGELGWSLYLSAHMKWLKKNGHPIPGIAVFPGREALYEGIASPVFKVPSEFHKNFDGRLQDCFTVYGVSGTKLRNYFNSRLPANYVVSKSQPFDCHGYNQIYAGKMLFTSYPYKTKLRGKKEILVFPRNRNFPPGRPRDLPKAFYINLINRLCDEFEDCVIRTMGTSEGAYNITEVYKDNYATCISKSLPIQNLIDRCQVAIGTVGSQSAPLKIALLQGVPTFMIGHQKRRHIKEENWRGTEADFYELSNYSDFNFGECIDKVVAFFKRRER